MDAISAISATGLRAAISATRLGGLLHCVAPNARSCALQRQPPVVCSNRAEAGAHLCGILALTHGKGSAKLVVGDLAGC
eukprot:836130-Prymnesium_polylepis.1